MEKLGYVNSFFKLLWYSMASEKRKEKIRRRRLHDLVMYAKSNSPYFAEAYAHIGDDFHLEDLPITNKEIMQANFDRWHTAPGIRLDDVLDFIADTDNIGKLYQGKYTIVMTSGSTGKPAIILQDTSVQNLAGVMAAMRAMKFQFPIVNVCDNTGYGIDNESIRHNKGKASVLNRLVGVVNSKQPEEGIVADLERIRPKVLFGYTGVVSLLANQAALGKLHIKPKFIFTSGEYMSESMREKIAKAFPTAQVHSIYGCTEGGAMAYECSHNHFHLNEDWTILEAVDENNNPVPFGQPAAKLLLTNLANSLHPLIRYELGDRAILHKDDCPCGRHSVWIEVDGRSNADLTFHTPQGEISVPSMVLYEVFEEINDSGLRLFDTYQMVLNTDQRLEVRLHCLPGTDREEAFREVCREVRGYLRKCGVEEAEMYLSDLEPQISTRTGKVIRVYQEDGTVGNNKHVLQEK